jgi:hypothetical protein
VLNELSWLVVPGGPGLSKKYLQDYCSKSFTGFDLYYFDLLGSPELNDGSSQTPPKLDELIWQLAKTDFKIRYNGSVLGYLWALLKPLLIFLILNFTFIKIQYFILK